MRGRPRRAGYNAPVTQDQLLILLGQLLLVLGLARLFGEIARRLHQPPMVGEILAGLVLGQTLLGQLAPELYARLFPIDAGQEALFDVTAEIGVLFLLLVIGLEVDVRTAWNMRRQSVSIAVAGVLVPLVVGAAAAWTFHPDWNDAGIAPLPFALFIGVAVSITAITVVARLLFDLRVVKSDLGLLLLSAMAINDLLGWAVLAVVLKLADAGGEALDLLRVAAPVLGALLFAAFAITLGRLATTRVFQALERWGLPSPETPLSLVICLALACGMIAHEMGLHPIFGYLLAGLMASEQDALSEHTRDVITQMMEAVFVPLFFASICLRLDFGAHFDWPLVLAITVLSSVGKAFGAWFGAAFARVPITDRVPIALAHMPGGSVGVLLAVVGVETGLIGDRMFVAIVFASVATSVLTGPALAWSLRQRARTEVPELVMPEAICMGIEATSRHAAIDELAGYVAGMSSDADVAAIRRAVHEREETMGTGVGDGIAVPHARIPSLAAPLVVFGRSLEGIDWNAVDDEPAHFVFLILTPSEDAGSQLHILRAISRGLRDVSVRSDLLHCDTREAVLERLRVVFAEDEPLAA